MAELRNIPQVIYRDPYHSLRYIPELSHELDSLGNCVPC